MTILQLLNQTVTGEALEFVQRWKAYQNRGITKKLDAFVDGLPKNQLEILNKKFKGIKNFYQMMDCMAEVDVAARYSKDKPVFLQESNTKTPDIYLENKNLYIEVKLINSSDSYKEWEEKLSRNGYAQGTLQQKTKDEARREVLPFLIRDAREKIDKATRQLKGKNGFIFLLYRVDPHLPYIGRNKDKDGMPFDLQEFLAEDLEKWIKGYAAQDNIKVVCEKHIYSHHEKYKPYKT